MSNGDFVDQPKAELDLIKRRAQLRQQLKTEFNKKAYNPFSNAYGVTVDDPSIQRHAAALTYQAERYVPKQSKILIGLAIMFGPILVGGYFLQNNKNLEDEKIRRGEITYEQRSYRLF